MTETLVKLTNTGKRYPRISRPRDRLRALGRLLRRREPASITVLEGVDLSVRRGESLGIVGENGAGKSTLLKLICGVLTPSTGEVSVNGHVGALLELGAGFHPQYTGRENLEMAGALMGLGRDELNKRMEKIIAFAGIGDYLDEPINHYSSGMVMRLGFALVTSVQPDLLITDEVLAVGDEAFQKKCVRWMEEYISGGGTLLLVSHSMYHIRKLCQRACWIHHGRMHMKGDVHEVTQAYQTYLEQKSAPPRLDRSGSANDYRITDFRVAGSDGEPPPQVAHGGDLILEGTIFSPDDRTPVICIGLVRADGRQIYGTFSDLDDFRPVSAGDGYYRFGLTYSALPLLPGTYQVRMHAMDPEGLRLFDTRVCEFNVRGETRELGYCRLHHFWTNPEETDESRPKPVKHDRYA